MTNPPYGPDEPDNRHEWGQEPPTPPAAWSPYGGRIDMPTLDRLAANGVTYSQWHTTALCSPTRSTFLTGRNHHLNGFAQIAEGAQGYPG